jgi:hypothetical protein
LKPRFDQCEDAIQRTSIGRHHLTAASSHSSSLLRIFRQLQDRVSELLG